jgi:hypothetical protein
MHAQHIESESKSKSKRSKYGTGNVNIMQAQQVTKPKHASLSRIFACSLASLVAFGEM